MSEQDSSAGPVALGEDLEDDELLDVLDAEAEDLGELDLEDEALELDDGIIVRQFAPEEIDVGDTNGPDLDLGLDLDEEDLVDDLLPPALPAATAELPAGLTEERLARLEAAARALAQAELAREQGRVRRKVTAATTGAGATGFIPIVLQLAGAFNLGPELAAAASTGAAILGALAAGWATPERKQVVAGTPAARDLLDEQA